MTVTINGTSGITTPEVTLDNTSADGGQVVLKSSGYDNWNLDNYNGRLRAYNGSTERMTIDTSGNVGLGVTPSAWRSVSKALQINSGASFQGYDNGTTVATTIGSNMYFNSSDQGIYLKTQAASYYAQFSGQHIFYTAPSGTAGTAATFTQAMTLDSSGNIYVGSDTACNLKDLRTNSISANGYQKLPGGIIIQWGNFNFSGGASGTVNFPIQFPNSGYAITGGISIPGNSTYNNAIGLAFASIAALSYNNSTSSTGGNCNWIAIGR